MRASAVLRDLSQFFLPVACVACRSAVPPELNGPLCVGCRTRLKSVPGPRCRRCGFPLGTNQPVAGTADRLPHQDDCSECREWPDELTSARTAVALLPPADAVIHGLKYEGWTGLAPVMAERMVRVARGLDVDLVVPVPTSTRRRRKRGYNQAELLARELAERLHLPFWDLLARRKDGPTQVSLPPDQRLANVRNAFAVKGEGRARVVDRSVLLVDDVLTTGATAGEVARTLVSAGATAVHLRAFARALPA
jgi:ComF family protein